MPTDHIDELQTQAEYARQRYQLYKARTFGARATSPGRLRELERVCEQAEARLRFAVQEQQRDAREQEHEPDA
jgi:hypothetical protein